MDLSTSVTTNISSRNTTHLSANKLGLLSYEKPHTIQVSRCRNEFDGMHRRCMPNPQDRQGKHLLSTTPTTKQVACWSLRMGTKMRNTTNKTGPSGFNEEPPKGPKTTSGVHQRKKEQHGRTHWTKCYRDGCWQHKEEKTKNHYYPR